MKSDAESNLLKAKNYLKINNIEYHELHPNTHFRIFIGRIPYSHREGFIDLWPTTLKWYYPDHDLKGQGMESFIKCYLNWTKVSSSQIQLKNNDQIQYPREFEMIKDGHLYVERLKVYGGWLVQSMHIQRDVLSTCFIPDPQHHWILTEVVKK